MTCPIPIAEDSAELATALHCVSAQWERGEHQAAVAGLADAVLIAEGEGHAGRAADLARALAGLALAARGAANAEEREKAKPAWKPEPPTAELIPIHVDSPAAEAPPAPATPKTEDRITARLAKEVLDEARARMRIRTADAFKIVPLASLVASTNAEPTAPSPDPALPLAPAAPPAVHAAVTLPPPSLHLGSIEPFSKLPDDIRARFAEAAEMIVIADGQELAAFGLALVIEGEVHVLPEGATTPTHRLVKGTTLFNNSLFPSGVRLRLTSVAGPTTLAIWSAGKIAPVLGECPSLHAKITTYSSSIHAVAGASTAAVLTTMEPQARQNVIAKLRAEERREGDVLKGPGKPISGLYLIARGAAELSKNAEVVRVLRAGDSVVPREIQGGDEGDTVRVAKGGALLLACDNATAHDLFDKYPELKGHLLSRK